MMPLEAGRPLKVRRQPLADSGQGTTRMMNYWMDFPGMGFGLTHWVIFAVFIAVVLYPVGRILDRIGFSPFWSVVA